MREIKFRGFSKELNKWFFGSLDNSLNWADFIITHEHGFGIKNRIDPDTIGQFTGLKDKKGTEIYEGDKTKDGYVIMWHPTKALFAEFFYQGFSEKWEISSYPINAINIEIIGNIHENTKLS